MMLEAVRTYYEREHQPPALREASGYLRRLTGGRYVRVWTPLGEHALRVDDNQGSSLRVEVLSRGTREQLFLALRLALVGSYARRGVRLPLVLDDVLVNFDAGRTRAAAAVLRDFARAGHQLLIFTCHEHIARLFKQLKAEVRQLPENGQALFSDADEPPARRTRRARPEEPLEPDVVPEPEPLEQEVAEIEPQTVTAPEPPPPAAPPRMPARAMRRIDRVEWTAEEFEGELADRVRRTPHSRRERGAASQAGEADDDEDAEAA
jgi:hypothetical protein